MNGYDETRARYPALLDGQLRLLEERRADVAALLEPGGERDEAAVDLMANDLVGVRLVLRASLLAPPTGATGAARDELELREREASDLLGAVLAVLPPCRLAEPVT